MSVVTYNRCFAVHASNDIELLHITKKTFSIEFYIFTYLIVF